jgi:hypothetical protein
VFLDIGAGCGNVLEDMVGCFLRNHIWGVEMNQDMWQSRTPLEWQDSIEWCKLEDLSDDRPLATMRNKTTVAYMYDLCLKRLSKKATCKESDPHYQIQCELLNPEKFPKLKYFISTYEEDKMTGHEIEGNKWRLVCSRKLPCSTNSYAFHLFERIKVC